MALRLRSRLNFANVVSVLALFLALGGGAIAAFRVPRNSIGTKQLKNGSITPQKLGFPLASAGAVRTAPMSVSSGSSADLDSASLNFAHSGNALSIGSVQLTAGKGGATVQLLLVHNSDTHLLATADIPPGAITTETAGIQCNSFHGVNHFTLRLVVTGGNVTTGQATESVIALPTA